MQPPAWWVLLQTLISEDLPEDGVLQLIQPALFQSISNRTKEAEVVLKIMHHKQDSSQQLIGHEKVVNVGTTMVLTAVAWAAIH